eukprot:scaffold124248_cov37-Tisochrysis_lutea.AAC.1
MCYTRRAEFRIPSDRKPPVAVRASKRMKSEALHGIGNIEHKFASVQLLASANKRVNTAI